MNILDIRFSRLEDITPEEALEVLDMFDQVADKLESIQQLGTPLPSEYSQFESILSYFLSKGSQYVKKVGGKQELEALRQADSHKEEYWWWRIDEIMAKDRIDRIKRWLTISLIGSLVIVIAVFLYQRYIAPDPATRALYSHTQSSESYLQAGNYDQALEQVNLALGYSPDNPGLLTLRGVILETQGEIDTKEADFQAALSNYEREEDFYTRRASLYLMTANGERALEDAQTARTLNSEHAYAYLLEAQAYELLGLYSEALEALELADEIAQRTDQVQVQAFARILMAQILQRPDQFPPSPTP
jgi:tetratricopeptide (TPR) repeat protein